MREHEGREWRTSESEAHAEYQSLIRAGAKRFS
jgi:hypothetical protein